MRAVDLIAKTRDGRELTTEEIEFLIRGVTRGDIPDYQAAAWLMAVYLRGLSTRETRDLTLAMAHSGDVLSLKDVVPFAVDKHSTGGVGDKVSLVVVPLAAACGLPVAKMSGRGLGFTGGTLDKLESIPGYRTDLSETEIKRQLAQIGMVLTGPTGELAPADSKLYALRDVTATVGSLPLIVSSILSKKIAGGADAVVLDVKAGQGALMQTLPEAETLARTLVSLAGEVGLRAVAWVSDMNQPLGRAIGNALEVVEAIEALHGRGPHDFREHCLTVVAEALALAPGANLGLEEGREIARQALDSGEAWAKFRTLVAAQGGDVRAVDEPTRLPRAELVEQVSAPRSGTISAIQAAELGLAVVALGGGRERKDQPVDHAVGLVVHAKVGDRVEQGQPLFTVHANEPGKLSAARERVLAAIAFSDGRVEPLPLFYGRFTQED
ncbi:MAG: thymidine phosphorylase [Anaerolineales bacterium]|nr:thymidine phosphorylase [Anaerolineales bacterium]